MGSIDKACISGFLCRLCSEMHRIVIHIYGDQGQRLCLVEKINGYLPITISPNDPLPKTICTTCLRRVEQHYDLLMRLSRIKEDRFLRVNNKRPRVSPISSIENSEDEVYQSDDSSRRQQQQRDIVSQRYDPQTAQNLSSTAISTIPLFVTAATTQSSNRNRARITDDNTDNDGNDDHSQASTSASAMAAISQHINVLHETNMVGSMSSSVTPSSPFPNSIENDNSFGIALQQQSD